MTVKITLEFPNVDAAIAGLAKLSSVADIKLVDGKPRKERKNKDAKTGVDSKAKGPEAGAQQGVAPQSGIPDAASTAAPAAASVPAASVTSPAATGPVPSAEEAQKLVEKLFEAADTPEMGIAKVKEVLASYSVARTREVPEDKRAEFMAAVRTVIEQVESAKAKK